jgi:hypothetical protein
MLEPVRPQLIVTLWTVLHFIFAGSSETDRFFDDEGVQYLESNQEFSLCNPTHRDQFILKKTPFKPLVASVVSKLMDQHCRKLESMISDLSGDAPHKCI